MVILWTEPAKEDLRNIYTFIAEESPFYAQNVIDSIIDTVEPLPQFPQMGRIVPELKEKNIRELFIYSYRIVYEITGEYIQINTIIHGKRDFFNNS